MPLPWQTRTDATADELLGSQMVPEIKGNVEPPKFERTLDIPGINTNVYFKEVSRLYRDRGVVSSAKGDCTMINRFCEENVQLLDQYSNSVPDDYDIDKDLSKTLSDKRLLTNLQRVNVFELNAVQRKAIKVIRDGIGLMVEAPTGIGKTYAFLIPAIERALVERKKRRNEPSKPSPFVLIIANTGTLVKQLHSRCELILGMKDMEGCESIYDIRSDMLVAEYTFTRGQCDIAFCTMGKLKSSIESGDVILDDLKMMILDEADKMIDTSAFGMDIEWVLDHLKEGVLEKLQVCFFSATFSRDFEGSLALSPLQMKMFQNNPFKLVHCPSMTGYISQQVIRINRPLTRMPLTTHSWVAKMNTIRALIDKDLATTNCQKEGPYLETIAIFCETVQRVAQVSMALRLLGYNFRPLCRTITKKQQEVTINDLEFKRIHGIVCTNIMSRGVDVSSIKHTIIMEMSTDFDTYKHRIGRVGRDGSGGRATVLIDHNLLLDGRSAQIVDQLYVFMTQCNEVVPKWLAEWFQSRQKD